MLAQVKKMAGGDLPGRLGAWWNGRDYVAPVPGEGEAAPAEDAKAKAPKAEAPKVEEKSAKAEVKPEKKKPEPAPEVAPVVEAAETPTLVPADVDGGAIRIKALETMWGEGRLQPGSFALDTKLLDAALELADKPGDIGFIGADGALLNAFAAQSDRKALATEWRAACAVRLNELVPSAAVTLGEVDRPRGFPDKSLQSIASVEAFAYADHKPGLVGRVHRALDETGRWVFLETTRKTNKTPPEAFASAWANPLLTTNDEIEELLKLAGFKSVRKVSVGELVIASAKQGYANLAQVLEGAATSGFTGKEGALFLQELAWEAQSWRARTRALEGGALEMHLWIADKTEQLAPLQLTDAMLDTPILPDDAGANDTLFEQAE
jgi:hypothetical protein